MKYLYPSILYIIILRKYIYKILRTNLVIHISDRKHEVYFRLTIKNIKIPQKERQHAVYIEIYQKDGPGIVDLGQGCTLNVPERSGGRVSVVLWK